MNARRVMSFQRSTYSNLLSSLAEGGYTCALFGERTEGRTVYLRHDVDKSLELAMAMAEMEAQAGVRANYFFLLRSPVYSLLERSGREILRHIKGLGHALGLHFHADTSITEETLDGFVLQDLEIFRAATEQTEIPVVSFHNPPTFVLRRVPSGGAYISAYEPRFISEGCKYLSDSNAHFQEGDPVPALRASKHERVQLLTHPIWWMHDKPRPAIEILAEVVAKRTAGLDAYLSVSNALWGEAREQGFSYELHFQDDIEK